MQHALLFFIMSIIIHSCGSVRMERSLPGNEYNDHVTDYLSLANHFAPRLYLHEDEPFEIVAIIPVLHPEKPVFAYHIFLEDDAFMNWGGNKYDHEIVWIEFDPVSLKLADVSMYWHRTVLRTEDCLMDAKASDQRPKVYMQWGQHGILPFGWEKIQTARPLVELAAHYGLVTELSTLREKQNIDNPIIFQKSYQEYLEFTKFVETRHFIGSQNLIIAEYSTDRLRSIVGKNIPLKKEWPFWNYEG